MATERCGKETLIQLNEALHLTSIAVVLEDIFW